MYDGHMYGFFGGFMWLFWLLLLAVIVWGISALAGRPGMKSKSALEILQERYARGEIDRDEYEQKRKDLGG